MEDYKIVVNKSTVPVGTGVDVGEVIRRVRPDRDFDVVSNPEFLREGSAIDDFLHPDRLVIGATSRRAMEAILDVYNPLYERDVPMVLTDVESAEMIKYASNALLAARISFINEIANICEAYGADVSSVARGMGFDERIGHRYLTPAPGTAAAVSPRTSPGWPPPRARRGSRLPSSMPSTAATRCSGGA